MSGTGTFDNQKYNIDFTNGSFEKYTENVIPENMFS